MRSPASDKRSPRRFETLWKRQSHRVRGCWREHSSNPLHFCSWVVAVFLKAAVAIAQAGRDFAACLPGSLILRIAVVWIDKTTSRVARERAISGWSGCALPLKQSKQRTLLDPPKGRPERRRGIGIGISARQDDGVEGLTPSPRCLPLPTLTPDTRICRVPRANIVCQSVPAPLAYPSATHTAAPTPTPHLSDPSTATTASVGGRARRFRRQPMLRLWVRRWRMQSQMAR